MYECFHCGERAVIWDSDFDGEDFDGDAFDDEAFAEMEREMEQTLSEMEAMDA